MWAIKKAALFAGVVAVSLATTGTASADPVETFHEKEYGFLANMAWSDCPWDSAPADGATCTTFEVAFGRFDEALNGGRLDVPGGTWFVEVGILTDVFDAETDSFQRVSLETGTVVDGDVSGVIDEQGLTYARLDVAIEVPLGLIDLETGEWTPTGRSALVGPLTWTDAGDRSVFGVGGPVAPQPHFHNECVTVNSLAHQKIRPATLSGATPLIDGTPVTALAPYQNTPPAAILHTVFHFSVVDKGCSS